jgi:hypothetical protein
MSEWVWVTAGYAIAYGALAGYTLSLVGRVRALRRRGRDER